MPAFALVACRSGEPELSPPLAAAQAAAQAEDWQTAQDQLQQAREENPASLTAQLNLALAQWRTGDLNDAIATFNLIMERESPPAEALQLYAQLLLEAGNPEGTHELLQNLEQDAPDVLTLGAMADIRMQRYERARLALENALERDPTYAPAWYHLALIHRDYVPNKVEAQIAFRTFKQFAPSNPRAAISSDAFIGTDLSLDPTHAVDTQSQPPAQQPDEIPLPLDPLVTTTQVPSPPVPSVQSQILAARQATESGDTDTALILYKTLVQENPSNPDAVWALAQFYEKELELSQRANGLYKTFQQLFPNDPRISQIPTATAPGQAQQQEIDQRDSARHSLLFQQGMDHFRRQEWDAAITAFRRVLALAPNDADAAFNLGLTYHKTSDLDSAAAAFQQALEHEKDMIKSLYMLGLTERDRNNIPDALRFLNRVIRLQPDFAKAHHALGRIYLKEGRPDMTTIHFQRIIEIDPQTPEAQTARTWLDRQP